MNFLLKIGFGLRIETQGLSTCDHSTVKEETNFSVAERKVNEISFHICCLENAMWSGIRINVLP